jgi:hypothetical protein
MIRLPTNNKKGIAMTTTVELGKRIVPLSHVMLIEPFDPAAHPGMRTDKSFKARVTLIDRQSVLIEETPESFIEKHGFRLLVDDQIGINASVNFSIERFEPTPGFEPKRDYRTRLQWRDREGEIQSKLLVSPPEVVLAIAVTGDAEPSAPKAGGGSAKRKRGSGSERRRARATAPEAQPT